MSGRKVDCVAVMSDTEEGSGAFAYHREPHLRVLATSMVAAGRDEHGGYAVCADTVLYPEGGGQPADHGTLEYENADSDTVVLEVIDVRRVDGGVRHYLSDLPSVSAAVPLGPCRLALDWPRRFDHMQQHSGQHLLSALAHDVFGWPTTSFHLGVEMADIELDVPQLAPRQIESLEEAVAAQIRAALPVRARHAQNPADVPASVRARGLPAGHSGAIRIVEIDGVDACACGCTHVANTAEIETLKLLHTEPMRGGTRVHFVAGGRVRRRLGDHESRMAALRGVVGVPDDELPAAVESRMVKNVELSRRLADTESRLAGAIAAELAAQAGPVAVARVDARLVAPVAQAFSRMAASPLLLVASSEATGPFALAAGTGSIVNVQVAGHTVAQLLGCRGGGSGQLFQGRSESLDRLDEAAAAMVSEPLS